MDFIANACIFESLIESSVGRYFSKNVKMLLTDERVIIKK
jgi:hypothetical protein